MSVVGRMHGQVARFQQEILGVTIPERPKMLTCDEVCSAHVHLSEELKEFGDAVLPPFFA